MSRVLVVGASGFIGRHLIAALAEAGHTVVAAGHAAGITTAIRVDLAHDSEATWQSRLAGIDILVNCAGVIRDRPDSPMNAIHAGGPARLFRACIAAGVARLVQVSALGTSDSGATPYQRSKAAAEATLRTLDPDGRRLDWCVLRPSVVIGRGGAGTALFTALAALPMVPRLGSGQRRLQPVHIDEVCALVVALLGRAEPLPRFVDVVGPEPMTTDALTQTLRGWLGLAPARSLPVPEAALTVTGLLGEWVSEGPVTREVVTMLRGGSTGNPAAMAAALGRAPRSLATALACHPATEADRWHARLYFLRRPLRWSLGALWLATALLSLGLYPLAGSYRLLALSGIEGTIADAALFGGAAVDGMLGLALLWGWRPAAVGAVQLAVMAAYTLIALALPAEYWLHPFAPLLKNLPLAMATLVMMALEART